MVFLVFYLMIKFMLFFVETNIRFTKTIIFYWDPLVPLLSSHFRLSVFVSIGCNQAISTVMLLLEGWRFFKPHWGPIWPTLLDVCNIRTATYKRMYGFFVDTMISVADPNFSFPHPGSEDSWIWIRISIKEFKYFYSKNCSKLSEIWGGIFVPDPYLDFYPSRIPGSKRHRIPDPDRNTDNDPSSIHPIHLGSVHPDTDYTVSKSVILIQVEVGAFMVPGAAGRIPRAEVARYRLPESIQWFIEEQTFSLSYDSAPPPLSPGNTLKRRHTRRLRKSDILLLGEEGGSCRIIRQRESLFSVNRRRPVLSGIYRYLLCKNKNSLANFYVYVHRYGVKRFQTTQSNSTDLRLWCKRPVTYGSANTKFGRLIDDWLMIDWWLIDAIRAKNREKVKL
jgi:hypothetical protein